MLQKAWDWIVWAAQTDLGVLLIGAAIVGVFALIFWEPIANKVRSSRERRAAAKARQAPPEPPKLTELQRSILGGMYFGGQEAITFFGRQTYREVWAGNLTIKNKDDPGALLAELLALADFGLIEEMSAAKPTDQKFRLTAAGLKVGAECPKPPEPQRTAPPAKAPEVSLKDAVHKRLTTGLQIVPDEDLLLAALYADKHRFGMIAPRDRKTIQANDSAQSGDALPSGGFSQTFSCHHPQSPNL